MIITTTIKNLENSEMHLLTKEIYVQAMTLIGQKTPDEEIRQQYFYSELSKHINKKYLNYTKFQIREAITYGAEQDNTGGSVYLQRVFHWLDKYHKEVWLPKNKHKIHNQPEMKTIAPKEITPQEIILNNYRSWKNGFIGYSFVRVFQALDDLGLKNDLWNNTVAWKFIYKAANKLKEEANQNQLFKEFRNMEAKIRQIENGKIATVSGDIIAEAKRLMVKELFENSSEDEIKMLIM